MKFAIKWFPPIALAALALSWISGQIAAALGFDPPPQDLVRILTNPTTPWPVKAKVGVVAVVVCPVIEEFVFRLGLHKWLLRRLFRLRFAAAAAISAAVFAAAHCMTGGIGTLLVTLAPLAFLGVAFAWVYERTDRLYASIAEHALFNLLNFALCLLFPQLVLS